MAEHHNKERGTADVTLIAWVDSRTSAAYLGDRFALRARQVGTVELVDHSWEDCTIIRKGERYAVVRVRLRYRHTCRNKGNHYSDAYRFFDRVIGTEGEHIGDVEEIILNGWEAVG